MKEIKELKNLNNPFIKVLWEDDSENFTQERIKRVKSYFESKYNTRNVTVITKANSIINNTTLNSIDFNQDISDEQYQKSLIKDFITDNDIKVDISLIERLDNKVNGELRKSKDSEIKYKKWYLKRIEFSNFLSFGENNVIDYTKFDGITLIESNPKNFGGKTTASTDLLLFLFFNKTTKTKVNSEIFNKFTNVDEVKVVGYINIDGEDYVIDRRITRKKKRNGSYDIEYKLDFFKQDSEGNSINLTGEQRGETEKIISKAIGTEDDFLTTILTTSQNLEDLIDSKPTARGQILTRFIGLDVLKEKEDICKTMYSEYNKKLLSNNYNVFKLEEDNNIYRDSINESILKIKDLEKSLLETESLIKLKSKKRDELLLNRNNDIDESLLKINPDSLTNDIIDLERQYETKKGLADGIILVEPEEYYDEDEHIKLKNIINENIIKGRTTDDQKKLKEITVNQLVNDKYCPTCKQEIEGKDHSEEIKKLQDEILKYESELITLREIHRNLNEKESKFVKLQKTFEDYEKSKLIKGRYELESEQLKLNIDNKRLTLNKFELNKKRLEDNKQIDQEILVLKTHIETLNVDIRTTTLNIQQNKNNITQLEEKINFNLEIIKKIKVEEEALHIYQTYLTIFGKNGLSKVILKNMIPQINMELYELLSDSCYFTLELTINEKNEVEFIMIDNETRIIKPLNAGSGYERTISALALRSVLTKVSSLPKPNIIVMDEVFGKVSDDNLDMVGEFFKKIKKYFEQIYLISHNQLIRNWSDNIILVKKEENVSSIEQITIKN